MSDPRIPPRPWCIFVNRNNPSMVGIVSIHGADDRTVAFGFLHDAPGEQTAEHIVRLVNAEPAIVAALEAADRALAAGGNYNLGDWERDRELVRAALAKVRP